MKIFVSYATMTALFFVSLPAAAETGANSSEFRGVLHPTVASGCKTRLANGIEIDFTNQVFRRNGTQVLLSFVIIGIPTETFFDSSRLQAVGRFFNEAWTAKVTSVTPERSYLAFDESFLSVFWGTDEDFSVKPNFPEPETVWFGLPADRRSARTQMSNALSCWQALQRQD